ncbi:uncharacterized protein LOC142982198 [Anticarsia gemmatalis]|uniref:uncharacterized protein LOC142982198 n=1 Tax=Anticarsia gemmatalis TaxID=129554 RepID=UPI003F767A51
MKLLVVLSVLAIVAFANAKSPSSRGCLYILGVCKRECEEGTHAYGSACPQPTKPEPTCEDPHPKEINPGYCDYSACYCDAPTVRDTISGKCVLLENCPNLKVLL